MNSLEKWMILTPLQKMPNNVGELGKIIVDTSFEWLSKVQKIAKSGHTDHLPYAFWDRSHKTVIIVTPHCSGNRTFTDN